MEIVIVVMIIGVLATLTIAATNMARTQSMINRCHADLRVISEAIEMLAFDTHQWPTGVPCGKGANPEVWNLNSSAAGICTNDGLFTGWQGPYMERVPRDPWGSHYFFDADYRADSDDVSVVGSFGPNKAGPNRYDDDDIYIVMR